MQCEMPLAQLSEIHSISSVEFKLQIRCCIRKHHKLSRRGARVRLAIVPKIHSSDRKVMDNILATFMCRELWQWHTDRHRATEYCSKTGWVGESLTDSLTHFDFGLVYCFIFTREKVSGTIFLSLMPRNHTQTQDNGNLSAFNQLVSREIKM